MLKNYFVFENAESKTADRTIIEKKHLSRLTGL